MMWQRLFRSVILRNGWHYLRLLINALITSNFELSVVTHMLDFAHFILKKPLCNFKIEIIFMKEAI
jgi:hypothetical protein